MRVIYLVRCGAGEIEARAESLLLEQAVELPRSAWRQPGMVERTLGRVEGIEPRSDGAYRVTISHLVTVPPLTWHQFRADLDEPLGFLCLVDCGRDPPERPDAAALAELRGAPAVAEFIRT